MKYLPCRGAVTRPTPCALSYTVLVPEVSVGVWECVCVGVCRCMSACYALVLRLLLLFAFGLGLWLRTGGANDGQRLAWHEGRRRRGGDGRLSARRTYVSA